MAERSVSAMSSATSPVSCATGPAAIASDTSVGAASKETPWPVAGASSITTSSGGAPGLRPSASSRQWPRIAASSSPGAPSTKLW